MVRGFHPVLVVLIYVGTVTEPHLPPRNNLKLFVCLFVCLLLVSLFVFMWRSCN